MVSHSLTVPFVALAFLAVTAPSAVVAPRSPEPQQAGSQEAGSQEAGSTAAAPDARPAGLPDGASLRLGTVRFRHAETLYGLAHSPDGAVLATAGGDRRIRLWSTEDGREMGVLSGFHSTCAAVAISDDGRWIAGADGLPWTTADEDGEPSFFAGGVSVWDLHTQELQFRLDDIDGGITCLAISPDGRWLAGGGQNGALRLWSLPEGVERWRGPTGLTWTRTLAFTPDGVHLAVGDAGGRLRILDPASGWQISQRVWEGAPVVDAEYAPGGGRLAVVAGGQLKLLDPTTLETTRRQQFHEGGIAALAFSPDGESLGLGIPGGVVLSETATGAIRRRWEADGPLQDLGFSTDGEVLAWCASDPCVVFRRVSGEGAEPYAELSGHDQPIRKVLFFPDGTRILSVTPDSLALWDASTGEMLQDLETRVAAAALSPGGEWIATHIQQDSIRVFDAADGLEVLTFGTDDRLSSWRFFEGFGFDAAGDLVFLQGDQNAISTWHLLGGERVRRTPVESLGEVTQFAARFSQSALSHDGRTMALAAGMGNPIWLVDVVTGESQVLRAGDSPRLITSLAFSADGERFAASSWDKTARVWDLAALEESTEPLFAAAFDDEPNAVAFSPDGSLLAVATGWTEGAILVLDSRSGERRQRFEGHGAYCGTLAFSPDGKRLASGLRDSTVLVWELD